MTSSVRGSAVTLSSAFVTALGVLSASAQLNPTVKVLPKPQTSVPTECEQGLAPAVPRVIVAEAEETKPSRATPPPSLDLKTQLRAVQLAAERGDRDAFKATLADARAVVASYPPGGERNAANNIVSVDSDLERLWDYEFTSPTGGFFDSSTDFVAMMRRYPDYARTIADQTLTAGGQTMYPTVETRRFLIAEASRRLSNLGVRTPTRIVEAPLPAPQPRVAPQPAPAPASRAVPEKPAVRKAERTPPRTTPHPSQHKAARKPVAKKTKPPVKVAEARGAPPPSAARKSAAESSGAPPPPIPVSAPAPATVHTPQPTVSTPMAARKPVAEGRSAPPQPIPVSAPAPAPVPTPQPTVAPIPPPATTTTAAEGGGAPQIPPQPTDTMSKTETTATTATTQTTAPARTPRATGGRMNLLFAIILIIVGIGVLIILFRASD